MRTPSILTKIRRSSKLGVPTEPLGERSLPSTSLRLNDRLDSATRDQVKGVAQSPPRCMFVELPAELRIQIYEDIASSTRLTVITTSSVRSETPRPQALLRACKQTRREYMPILFALAAVTVRITSLDFSPLLRVTGGLYRAQLLALRENPRLLIILNVGTKCSTSQLRRWLTKRGQNMDRLPWSYEVASVKPGGALTRINMLDAYLEIVGELKKTLHESLQMELMPIEIALIMQRVKDSAQLTGQPLQVFLAGFRRGS